MRPSDFMAHGIHPPTLARLVEEGVLVRRSRGLYELADAEVELNHSLAEKWRSGFRRRDLPDLSASISPNHLQVPSSVWMAIGGEGPQTPDRPVPPPGLSGSAGGR